VLTFNFVHIGDTPHNIKCLWTISTTTSITTNSRTLPTILTTSVSFQAIVETWDWCWPFTCSFSPKSVAVWYGPYEPVCPCISQLVKNCWQVLRPKRRQKLGTEVDLSLSTSYVSLLAGTRGTSRRRRKGWYSCWWTPGPRWSGRTSLIWLTVKVICFQYINPPVLRCDLDLSGWRNVVGDVVIRLASCNFLWEASLTVTHCPEQF